MRPKSMATVVVVLFGVPRRSSTPTLASVIGSSMRSGVTSETLPTKVVLPTPNAPATTIFADRVTAGARKWGAGPSDQFAESTQHLL